MSKATPIDNPKEVPESRASENLQANVNRLTSLMGLLPTELKRVTTKLKRTTAEPLKNISISKKPAQIIAEVERISRGMTGLTAEIDEYIKARTLTYDWIGVMLFTFVEAYLEDGFVLIAKKNPQLMWKADPLPPKRVLEAASIEELKNELAQDWANRMIKGGPKKWLEHLKGMGARNYKKDSGDSLLHLWDTRNLIVHQQRVASPDYERKYPHPELKAGGRVRIGQETLKCWFAGVQDFVHHTDKFFSKYPDKASSISL